MGPAAMPSGDSLSRAVYSFKRRLFAAAKDIVGLSRLGVGSRWRWGCWEGALLWGWRLGVGLKLEVIPTLCGRGERIEWQVPGGCGDGCSGDVWLPFTLYIPGMITVFIFGLVATLRYCISLLNLVRQTNALSV